MRKPTRRRALQLGVCSPILALFGLQTTNLSDSRVSDLWTRPAVKLKSKSINVDEKLVESQPGLESGAGTLWGYLVTSEKADRKVRWSRWPTINGKSPPRIEDFSDAIGVFVVGIPEPGYELREVTAPSYDRKEVTHTYTFAEMAEGATGDRNLSFHYDFIRWELNGAPSPEKLDLQKR